MQAQTVEKSENPKLFLREGGENRTYSIGSSNRIEVLCSLPPVQLMDSARKTDEKSTQRFRKKSEEREEPDT